MLTIHRYDINTKPVQIIFQGNVHILVLKKHYPTVLLLMHYIPGCHEPSQQLAMKVSATYSKI